MKYTIPNNLVGMTPYKPIIGDFKIRMDANESYINIDDMNMILKELNRLELNRYPDPYAKKLCSAFAKYYGVDESLITASNGSDEMIALIFSTLFKSNNKVAVFENDFSMYEVYCNIYGINYTVLKKQDDLTIDVKKVSKEIENKNITALIFSNPCNPTSIGLKREDVLYLVKNTDALIILDEAYMDFWDNSVIDKVSDFDNLIILKTCSKAIGLAGIRLGFAIANEKITNLIRAIKSPYNVNVLTQKVGELVLSKKEMLKNACVEIIKNKNELQKMMNTLKEEFPNIILNVYNSKTNFIFIKTRYSKIIFENLLKNSIAIRYMGDYLRINTSNTYENEVLFNTMKEILKNL